MIVEDADSHYARALAGGAVILDEISSPEYGGRADSCKDIEGHAWWFWQPQPLDVLIVRVPCPDSACAGLAAARAGRISALRPQVAGLRVIISVPMRITLARQRNGDNTWQSRWRRWR